MKPNATHLKRTVSGGMVPWSRSPHFDRAQLCRVEPDFFVGLAVAMPVALVLWAVVVCSVWLLMW